MKKGNITIGIAGLIGAVTVTASVLASYFSTQISIVKDFFTDRERIGSLEANENNTALVINALNGKMDILLDANGYTRAKVEELLKQKVQSNISQTR